MNICQLNTSNRVRDVEWRKHASNFERYIQKSYKIGSKQRILVYNNKYSLDRTTRSPWWGVAVRGLNDVIQGIFLRDIRNTSIKSIKFSGDRAANEPICSLTTRKQARSKLGQSSFINERV